jgi:hypothetical protein
MRQQLGITDDYRLTNRVDFCFRNRFENNLRPNSGRVSHSYTHARPGHWRVRNILHRAIHAW